MFGSDFLWNVKGYLWKATEYLTHSWKETIFYTIYKIDYTILKIKKFPELCAHTHFWNTHKLPPRSIVIMGLFGLNREIT